jgi:RimJ/RimL family protein N-acetyltransferase
MSWHTTAVVDEFLAEAGPFIRADPVQNTVILTMAERLRVRPVRGRASAADMTLFGWWRPAAGQDPVSAAFMHTPGFPVVPTAMTDQAAAELAGDLAATGRHVAGVNAAPGIAEAFAASWRQHTGAEARVGRRTRLFRLDQLIWPDPRPAGTSRKAGENDRALLTEWFHAFARETRDVPGQDHAAAVDDRLGYGGITIWEAGGALVSFAAANRLVAGTVRIGPVYTPPDRRGHGYAAGATAAVTQAALDAGATDVLLFTDLANPTSNALYPRLGYRPVGDRLELSFVSATDGTG